MSFAIYRAKNALLFWTTIFIFMTNSFIFYSDSNVYPKILSASKPLWLVVNQSNALPEVVLTNFHYAGIILFSNVKTWTTMNVENMLLQSRLIAQVPRHRVIWNCVQSVTCIWTSVFRLPSARI
jgi:hypothetical protein